MKAKQKGGFTLIEVVIAMGISLIVLLAVGAVLVASHTRWNDAWVKVNLQQDASYVMHELSKSIKEAASATVEDNGKKIQIYDTDGNWVKYTFNANTDTLQYQVQEQSTQTLIDGYVEDLEFNVEDNKVKIDLTLKKDDQEVHLDSTVQMRNYGL
ncbi:PilW family protein [Planctomycetota bacterium]